MTRVVSDEPEIWAVWTNLGVRAVLAEEASILRLAVPFGVPERLRSSRVVSADVMGNATATDKWTWMGSCAGPRKIMTCSQWGSLSGTGEQTRAQAAHFL